MSTTTNGVKLMDPVASSQGVPTGNFVQSSPIVILNRFTSIEKMFEILTEEKLRMSDYHYWEDKNDVSLLDEYKAKVGIKSLFVLCLTDDSETIHHWGSFSEKLNACCIEFDVKKLLGSISRDKSLRYGKVKYIRIKDLKRELTNVKDIPFSKRFPYRNESEYRIIFESQKAKKEKATIVNHEMIKRITINQHIAKDVFNLIKREIEGKYKIKVNRSTVINNKTWINYVKNM